MEVWRILYPKGRDFTHYSQVHSSYSRIDYVFLDHQLLEGLLKAEVKSFTLSDHAPVIASLDLKNISDRQKSLLFDQGIVENLKRDLNLFFKENNVENIAPTVLWETHKVFMRKRLIVEGVKRKKIWTAQKQSLLQEIRKLEQLHKNLNDNKVRENMRL